MKLWWLRNIRICWLVVRVLLMVCCSGWERLVLSGMFFMLRWMNFGGCVLLVCWVRCSRL